MHNSDYHYLDDPSKQEPSPQYCSSIIRSNEWTTRSVSGANSEPVEFPACKEPIPCVQVLTPPGYPKNTECAGAQQPILVELLASAAAEQPKAHNSARGSP